MKNFDFEETEEFEDPEEVHFKEKSKRALRRQHKNKMKNKAKRKCREKNWFDNDEELIEDFAVKNADHLANCSCYICGNPRRYAKGKNKYTRQELLEDQKNYQ